MNIQKIKFVSAQPDLPYFHWQTIVYVNNFIRHGINPRQIHVLFALQPKQVFSPNIEKLKQDGVNFHYYDDNRKLRGYIPSIKPYLVSKWVSPNDIFFLHDSDIIFNYLPNFNKMEKDDVYLSDTRGYIGYNYIADCCQRYKDKYSYLKELNLLDEMAKIVGIDIQMIKENEMNSGGAQYLVSGTNADFWEKVYLDSEKLYSVMYNFNEKYRIDCPIQMWTAEMWSILWNFWKHGHNTRIVEELSFAWATDDIEKCNTNPILHMAGITEDMKGNRFYKGDFMNCSPVDQLVLNPNFFDYVEKNSSSWKYVEDVKKFVGSSYLFENSRKMTERCSNVDFLEFLNNFLEESDGK